MLKEIFRQQAHVVIFQGMVVQQAPYIDVDVRSYDFVEVELEAVEIKGIHGRVIVDEVWPPGVDNLSEFPVMALAEEGR